MVKTLEEIKGMNIPLGTPIELTLNDSVSSKLEKNPNNKIHKELGYFQGVRESVDHSYGELIYTPRLSSKGIEHTSEDYGCLIPYIEDIKLLGVLEK